MPRISSPKVMRAALLTSLYTCVFILSAGSTFALPRVEQGVEQKKEFAKCWTYKTSPDLSIRSESDISNIYFVDTERRLFAVDLQSGSTVWSTELGGTAVSNVLVTNESVILATTGFGSDTESFAVLRSVRKQTGITNWFVKIANSPTFELGAVNGTVTVLSPSGVVSAFATSNGESKWSKGIGANITTAPFFSDAAVFVGTDRNEIISIAGASGDMTVTAKTTGIPAVVFSDISGRALVGDDRGNLVFIGADGKRLWRFRNGARISAISIYDSEFLVASNDNFVYKLSRSGNVEWKRRLSSRIDGRPLVLDKVAVFATVGDGNVYVIDLTNGKVLNRFENGEDNASQAVSAGSNFVMVTEDALTLYSRGPCSQIKKTVPE